MPRKIKAALVEDVDTEDEWLELLSKEVHNRNPNPKYESCF